MSRVYLELDGEPVLADHLAWQMVAPCGCVSGVTVVESQGVLYAATAEQAWGEFFEGAADKAKQRREQGFTVRLARLGDSRMTGCIHEPRYGVPSIPTPDGMKWAAAGRYNKPARRTHLVTAEEIGSRDKIATLCGASDYGFSWMTARHYTVDLIECSKCLTKAGAA